MAHDPDIDQQLAERFVAALVARDVARACALVADDVELVDAHGSRQGIDAVRDWITASATTIQPLRWRRTGDGVALEHLATSSPREPERGRPHVAVQGALALRVHEERIVRIDATRMAGAA